MHSLSRWLAAAAAVLAVTVTFAQEAASAPQMSSTAGEEPVRSPTTNGPLTIVAIEPQRAAPGDVVRLSLSRAVWAGSSVQTGSDASLVVLVADTRARIDRVDRDTIWFVVPNTSQSYVPVVVKHRGKETGSVGLRIDVPEAPSANSAKVPVQLPRGDESKPSSFTATAVTISSLAAVLAAALAYGIGRGQRSRGAAKVTVHPAEEADDALVRDDDRIVPQPAPPPGLVRACADGECVLFSGQGLDLLEGYRPLTDLLREFIDASRLDPAMRQRLREGLASNETDAVLDILLAAENGADLTERVARDYREAAPRRNALEALRFIDFAAVVTTSVTPSLAHVFRNRGPLEIPLPRADNVSELLQSTRFPIIRLFGHAAAPDTLILSRTEMRRVIRGSDFLSKYLTSLLATRTHVFVGVSAKTIDEYFAALQWGTQAGRHYAVLQADRTTELHRERLKARYGLEVIEIPATNAMESTRTFIEDLGRAVKADKASSAKQRAADVPTLGRLALHNIGAFASLDLPLSPGWNVLLGNNASGKSTILRAIAAALCGDDPRAAVVAERLLRADASSGWVELTIGSEVYRAEFIRELKRVRIVNRQLTPLQTGRALVLGFPAMRGIGYAKGAAADSSGDVLPTPDVADILPLIAGDTDPRTDSVKQWLIDLEARRFRAGSESWRYAELRNRFFHLLNVFTPGLPIAFARVDFEAKQVFVMADGTIVPLDYVSQGMISVIAWIGTLLQRMYAVRANSPDPTKEPAVVLIDEIDAHLHPEWQQEIVVRLKSNFPNVQFIATTHSPLVVAGLRREEVFVATRDMEPGSGVTVIPSPIHFEGLRADQILTSPLFGLSSTRQLHVDRYSELLAKSARTPVEERELEILRASIAEPDEMKRTTRLRHALDDLASEEGFEALLSGGKADPEMRERLLSVISKEASKR